MSDFNQKKSLRSGDIEVNAQVTPLEVNLTVTKIVAGAIATRDSMPVHHDKDFANSQGVPHVFLNILSTNAYVARFLTDWAGPEAMVKKIAIRLGVPAIPGQVLTFSGEVLSKTELDDECEFELSLRAATPEGDHATGTALLSVPL